MSYDIRNVKSIDDLIRYFIEELHWNIDLDDFDEIDDITYDFDAADIGLKEEAFANISSLRQLQPISDYQKWGIFCVEFDSDRFVVSALRKILSGLVPKRRNAAEHAVWSQKDLLFLCFWGRDNNRTIGIAHFEDKENGLPLIKMISCAPAIEEFTNIKYFEEQLRHLSWVRDESDIEAWYEQWSSAFTASYREVIQTSSALTLKLAAEAQKIRNRILEIYDVETDDGYVHKLYEDFKQSLIHDMTEQQFADMYAQTVVYGLFSARCMDKTPDDFSAREAVDCIPITNPFLKRLMEECLGEGVKRHLTFDELEVSNVIDILLHTNTEMILKDFNRQTGGGREDPVIHFYEEFLTAYDKAQKVQRGVFYTPQPVVNFIIRAVDSLLKTDFGLDDGLGSEAQKEILVEVDGKKRRERIKVPAVQILDPATGTGTFIRQTILQIYENFRKKHKGENDQQLNNSWSNYVSKHLLPRINAFELMMAPYAVAHMKIAMVLKDTGYDFTSEQRLKVYLTNSLEPAGKADFQLSLFENDPLAFESIEANQAKKNNGINVIIGNPPYSLSSCNKSNWILDLISDYKKGLNERKVNLDDDYIKFIRYGEHFVTEANYGILAYITNNSFLDGITHREMRKHLMNTFNKIFILNLHGNSKKKETSPDGSKDENVFDIQQGVSIFIGVRSCERSNSCIIKYIDLYGLRERKYDFLLKRNLFDINFTEIENTSPNYFFVPKNLSDIDDYQKGFGTNELLVKFNSGIQTKNDKLSIKNSEEAIKSVWYDFKNLSKEQLISKYHLKDSAGWKIDNAISDINNHKVSIINLMYRTFDNKFTLYTGFSSGFLGRPRDTITNHFITNDNIGLLLRRNTPPVPFTHVFLTNCMISEGVLGIDPNGRESIFPLYIYSEEFGEMKRTPNLNDSIVRKLSQVLKLPYDQNSNGERIDSFSPIDIVDYIYAVLHSQKYRTKYEEFLRIDFPRVPYPKNTEYFFELVKIGSQLRKCHLFQIELDTNHYSFIGDGNNEVVKPSYNNGKIYINKSQFFSDVSQSLWGHFIGGYQPLQKWLKDRKKTFLSAEDVEHYKKIIAALKLTQELMAQIDEIVDL